MARFHSALVRVSYLHRRAGRQAFQAADLSEGQPKVLSVLMNKEGCLQKELARQCRVEPATMTSLLKKMTTGGLIRKEAVHVSGGKRAYGIYLTEEGRAKAKNVERIMSDLEEASYAGFSDEEKAQLISYLERVSDNLTRYTDEKEGNDTL